MTVEVEAASREIAGLTEQLKELPVTQEALLKLVAAEEEVVKSSVAAAEKKRALDDLSAQMSALAVRQSFLGRFDAAIEAWSRPLAQLKSRPPESEAWLQPGSTDPVESLRPRIAQAVAAIESAFSDVASVREAARSMTATGERARVELDERARALRREIETLQQGAGVVSQQGAALRSKKAQLDVLQNLVAEKQKKMSALKEKRADALERLDELRDRRFARRCEAAIRLNESLGPRIRVNVERAAQFDEYAQAIASALRGSGLHYADLAPGLARRMSPRELLEAVETSDFESIADICQIAKDRAARVGSQLREKGLAEIASCLVEDNVRFQLLDGQSFKDISELSTGQRCTVVLPLVLEHHDRVLIVDQPEDHIDNAFIADTVIKAIRNRSPDSQMIFSTHNANIPVLGEAEHVVMMGSDGRRGFVLLARELNAPEAVTAITNVMEGGHEAFRQRAAFYSRHES